MFYRYFKRFYDLILSLIGLVILIPIFVLLIIIIKIDSKGPILFKQKRVGRNKKYFYILKFRTMYISSPKDTPTHLLENPNQWITKIGRILRKTSLDELPQIINIIKGEMSIVGPRPALWNQYDLIEERDIYGINEFTPGLTGYAQIHGRDELNIQDKTKLDAHYCQNISFGNDFKIILKTIVKVFKREGIVKGKK